MGSERCDGVESFVSYTRRYLGNPVLKNSFVSVSFSGLTYIKRRHPLYAT